VKGDDSATVETPPNSRIFDFVPENSKSMRSTLQKRRDDAQAKASTAQGPVINFNMPPELFGRPPVTPANPQRPSESEITVTPNSPLYPPSIKPQVPLTLVDFCAMYNLSGDILSRFTDNGFTTLNQLCYISLTDLKEMVFKRGEIAGIQDAIAVWMAGLKKD
jgi:hypothetical protein